MNSVQEMNMNFNSRMKVNFDGGDLTSDAGLLLYKSFDHKLGLSDSIHKQLVVMTTSSIGIIRMPMLSSKKYTNISVVTMR
jgi:hypothetical protein